MKNFFTITETAFAAVLLASAVAVHAADEATERRLGIRAVANGDYSNAVNFFKSALALSGEDQALFERLRVLRMEIAKEEKIPPYIVFSDKTLISMCQLRPKNLEELLEVSGVGVVKAEKYGERFLHLLALGNGSL